MKKIFSIFLLVLLLLFCSIAVGGFETVLNVPGQAIAIGVPPDGGQTIGPTIDFIYVTSLPANMIVVSCYDPTEGRSGQKFENTYMKYVVANSGHALTARCPRDHIQV